MIYQSTLSIIPCRLEPSDQSEMVTQLLYGERFEVIKSLDKWVEIKMIHDDYVCFIDKKQSDDATIVSETTNNSNYRIIDIPISKVTLDEEPKYLCAGSIIEDAKKIEALTLKEYALQYVNAPYLWGGRTIAGIDCSGYSQLIYRLMGVSIPRDAYQQAELGETVSFVTEAKEGDLAFFDNKEGRITHVGIILIDQEERYIIHASGKVRVDKIDHHGIYNSDLKSYTHKLRVIKRIF